MASLAGIPAQYSKKNSAVKRIMQEARELVREPSTDFAANPLDTDIFEWHFTIRGPEDTDFEGGLYHGRILLPNNYPFAPPSLMFLTPNGRFELHKKVCLSITGYHPEYWQPAWGIRTVLVAVMGFLPTQSKGAIGGLDTSVEARKALAIRSKTWTCSTCRQENIAILPDVAPEDVVKASLKADEMPPEFSFGYEADKKKQQEDDLQDKSKSSSSSTGDGKEQQEATTEAGQASALPAQTQTQTQTQAHTQAPTLASATPSSLTSTSSLSSSSPPLSSPSVTGAAAAAVSLAATSSAPRDPPRPPVSQSPAELRQRTMTPQSTQRHAAGRAQTPTLTQTQVGHARSNSPWWLDALIFAFGGILVALVLRRFL